MRSIRVLSIGVVTLGFLLGVLGPAFPLVAHAAWVNTQPPSSRSAEH